MTISLYAASIPVFKQMLGSLSDLLHKAEAHASSKSIEPSALLQARLGGVGTQLLQAISDRFRRIGVRKLRTIVALENTLILSFFRAQGMMAGPLIALEMDLDA